ALFGLGTLDVALRVHLGLGLRRGRLLMRRPVGSTLLGGLLGLNRILGGHGLSVRRQALLGGRDPDFGRVHLGLLGLGFGHGLRRIRFLAFVRLGLLELPLGGQRFVSRNRAGDLFGFAFDRVDQAPTRFVGLALLTHHSP